MTDPLPAAPAFNIGHDMDTTLRTYSPRDVGEKHGILPTGPAEQKMPEVATCFGARGHAWAELSKLGLGEYIQMDPRPTFVVESTASVVIKGKTLQTLYNNPALLRDKTLMDEVHGRFTSYDAGSPLRRTYSDFLSWASGESRQGPSTTSFLYRGFLWSAVSVQHWRIVSGVSYIDVHNCDDLTGMPAKRRRGSTASISSKDSTNGTDKPTLLSHIEYRDGSGRLPTPDNLERSAANHCIPEQSSSNQSETERIYIDGAGANVSFDWTQHKIDNPSAYLQTLLAVDWASSLVGPIATWSPELRVAANMLLTDPGPAVLFWGPEGAMIYNEDYTQLIEIYHPQALGTSVFTSLKEYRSHTVPVITHIRQTGESVYQKDVPLFLVRDGVLEEGWFDLLFIPILNNSGQVAGIFQQIRETTEIRVTQRRLNAYISFGQRSVNARNLGDFWRLAFDALEEQDMEVPFALLYSIAGVDEAADGQAVVCSKGMTDGKVAMLKASVGVEQGHACAPIYLCLDRGDVGFTAYFRQAIKTRQAVVANYNDAAFPRKLLEGMKWRGYGEPCRDFVISPITPTGSDNVLGFFVVGINPRRPYDDNYQQFIRHYTMLLATSLASVVLLEEEVERRKLLVEQSEHLQAELSQQLEVKQRRIEASQKKLQRLAQRADIAIFIVKPDGEYAYRNQRWYDLFREAKEDRCIEDAWSKLVDEEDQAYVERMWHTLAVKQEVVSFELRLKRKWQPAKEEDDLQPDDEDRKVWVLISAYPELNEDGTLKELACMVTDISSQKWAEKVQKQRARDALESKRALENFIDTTSHEMRNPLSAITQTADGLLISALKMVSTYKSIDDIPSERKELMHTVIESAQTIIQCSNHQRRIVDDVLTMSKLDSSLLTIFPVDSQPENEIRYAMKVFESEAKESKVALSFTTEDSYKEVGIDWVLLDPTRLVQVFINLLTNAIKFTRLEKTRSVAISIGASESPPHEAHGVHFDTSNLNMDDPTLREEWGEGDPVYLIVTVVDTGRGLTPEEQDLLFMRFSQASPRTHVTYGGSGLGLYISRKLTEMQGGAVSFASTQGTGSTFAFYIKARRSLNANPSSRLPFVGQFDLHDASVFDRLPQLMMQSSNSSNSSTVDENEIDGQISDGHPNPELGRFFIPDVIHILVVEDNLVNQKVLAKQLRSLGCIVDVANHGVEALAHIETTRFWARTDDSTTQSSTITSTACPPTRRELTLILMDWEMPVMDGVTCVREIRSLQSSGQLTDHIPVIAVTANARQEQIDTAMKAGFDDLCTKPCRVPDLMIRMKTLLGRLGEEREGGRPTRPVSVRGATI